MSPDGRRLTVFWLDSWTGSTGSADAPVSAFHERMHMDKQHMPGSYRRFAAMVASSTAIMYGVMYLNTYSLDHVYFSETRLYMSLVMGATMAMVMLAFMLGMYTDKKTNALIFAGSALVFAVALWLVRSQATVDQLSWMKAMIPHHSIAILTSERARIEDPRVRELADGIIESQRKEIGEMERLIVELRSR
jgi:hypothetical protein